MIACPFFYEKTKLTDDELYEEYYNYYYNNNMKSREKIIKSFLFTCYICLRNYSNYVFSEDDFQTIICDYIKILNSKYDILKKGQFKIRTAMITWIKQSIMRLLKHKYKEKRNPEKECYYKNIDSIIDKKQTEKKNKYDYILMLKIIFDILKHKKTNYEAFYFDIFYLYVIGFKFVEIGRIFKKSPNNICYVYFNCLHIIKNNNKIKKFNTNKI